MDATKKITRKINERFARKQSVLWRIPAEMGDGMDNLEVPGRDGYIYVRVNNKPMAVFNNRVPNQNGTGVWVGYAPDDPQLVQVLSTRGSSPTGEQTGYVGYAPAKRYEWHAVHGGQDPLYVHLRAMTPLRLSVSSTAALPGEMFVNLYRGFIFSGAGYIHIDRQDLNLYDQIPATADKAAFILITIDTTGNVIQTAGAEVDIDALALSDIPDIPLDTAFVCGAVRVYYGQEIVREGRTNTDFVDLRFTSASGLGGGLWGSLTGDIVNQADLQAALDAKLDDSQLDTDTLLAADSNTKIPSQHAAKTYMDNLVAGIGTGDLCFKIDGGLAVVTDAHTILITRDTTISQWYISCDNSGSASSTIYDVHLNGTTIFTTQANRPTLAYNDADRWAVSGTPDVVDFVEGDILTVDIDQIATGAEGLTGVGQIITPAEAAAILNDYILIEDQKAQNTSGGTFTSGADRTRDLNTEVSDTGGHASVSGNQITLAAGTYIFKIIAPAYKCERHQAWLYNVTDAAVVERGSSEYSDSAVNVQTRSIIAGRFTIASSEVFEVRHRCQTTSSTRGFGVEANFGTEVYTIAEFWKVG